MADVHLLSVRLVDVYGKAGHVNIFVPSATTLAQVQAYYDTVALTLDAITGAKIDSATVALALVNPGGLKAAAIADQPIQWGANWGFDVLNTPYRWTMHVPAILSSLVTGEDINRADADVVAFEADLVTGDGTVAPTGRDGGDLVSVLDAKVSFRKA